MMDVGHPAGDGVLHRDQSQLAIAAPHGVESVLECGVGRGLVIGEIGAAGFVAVGASFSLEGDARTVGHAVEVSRAMARAASRSAAVSTEIGAADTIAAWIARPISRARSCSSLSRSSSGDGGAAQKRWSADRR